MRSNKGFTLIEIMAVIAIIIILIGILAPAINTARRQARKLECMSNLRQIGVAIQSYVMDDTNGLTPAAIGNLSTYFDNGLTPYCPAQTGTNPGDGYALLNAGIKLDTLTTADGIAQDSAARHNGKRNIVYADGHVATQ